jgi:hypothetical protein
MRLKISGSCSLAWASRGRNGRKIRPSTLSNHARVSRQLAAAIQEAVTAFKALELDSGGSLGEADGHPPGELELQPM